MRNYARVALWYHDVVYKIGRPDKANIEESITQMRRELRCALPESVYGLVIGVLAGAVRRGTRHDADSEDLARSDLENAVHDIDLAAGFALEWPYFVVSALRFRAEHWELSEREYFARNIQFLSKLLARERIYLSPGFEEEENLTRANISRLIEWKSTECQLP